jgi:hypothetical protein
METLLRTGIAGIGAVIGSGLTFLGFKSRIENLEEKTVTKETCVVVQKSFHDSMDSQNEMLTEMRADIKQILRNGNT